MSVDDDGAHQRRALFHREDALGLRANLAVDLAPEFGRPLDALILQSARESLADVKRANFPMVEVGIDVALTGGGGAYNILTDT